MSTALSEEDAVPEMLLALAKDHRYVRQCDVLLKEMYAKAPSGVAWLLYALLVVRRRGRTLGMDFTGIELNTNGGRRLWLLMAASAMTSMLIEYSCREHNDDQDSSSSNEQLRGRARRRRFEEQRRAMMQRASAPIQSTPLPRQIAQSQVIVMTRRLVNMLKQTLLDLSSLTLADEGPHVLPSSAAASTIGSLAKVLIRLQVIRFCLKGKLPLWNMLGIKVDNKRQDVLANRPNLHRFVALLLAQQVLATTVRGTVQLLTKLWMQRRQRPTAQPFSPAPAAFSSTELVCGICKLPRVHPAIPKACGHVFCWKCLYQWVAVTRPECPLCRAPCRAQDIMALYHYRP